MSFLEKNFPFLNDFLEGCQSFNNFYEKNIDDPDFQVLIKKLKIYEKFLITIEKLDNDNTDMLFGKVEKDKDYFNNMIFDKKTKLYPLNKDALIQFDDDSFTLNTNTSEDSSDSESVSSLDDINSQNSDKEDDEFINNPETVYVNKMFAKAIIEFNIRKDYKDIRADKIEDEGNVEEISDV